MNFLVRLIHNNTITIPVLAWFIAQLTKVFLFKLQTHKFDLSRFIGSGGMPSSHSAFIVCLTTVIGKNLGSDSYEFGIAVAVSLVIMYDAAGVRRAAGRHAEILNELLYEKKHHINTQVKLKELLGHSPFEVSMGALLGLVLGLFFG